MERRSRGIKAVRNHAGDVPGGHPGPVTRWRRGRGVRPARSQSSTPGGAGPTSQWRRRPALGRQRAGRTAAAGHARRQQGREGREGTRTRGPLPAWTRRQGATHEGGRGGGPGGDRRDGDGPIAAGSSGRLRGPLRPPSGPRRSMLGPAGRNFAASGLSPHRPRGAPSGPRDCWLRGAARHPGAPRERPAEGVAGRSAPDPLPARGLRRRPAGQRHGDVRHLCCAGIERLRR